MRSREGTRKRKRGTNSQHLHAWGLWARLSDLTLGRSFRQAHQEQSPAVLVKPERQLRSGSPVTTVPVKVVLPMNRSPMLDSWGQQPKRMGTV